MRYNINLLPKKKEDIVDKALFFSLHYLRYILVITQFFVVCVFFFRFRVDQEIVDLKDELSKQKTTIERAVPILQEANRLDFRLTEIKTIFSLQEQSKGSLDYFISRLPQSVTVSSLTLRGASLDVAGFSSDAQEIERFYDTIENEAQFKTIELSNIRKADDVFSFSMELQNYQTN